MFKAAFINCSSFLRLKPFPEKDGFFLCYIVIPIFPKMLYNTVYSTFDCAELSIIRHRFEVEDLDFKVLDEATNAAAGLGAMGANGVRIQVVKSQVPAARKYLKELGFTGVTIGDNSKEPKNPARKWIVILLAILVLILVSFLIMYMNPN